MAFCWPKFWPICSNSSSHPARGFYVITIVDRMSFSLFPTRTSHRPRDTEVDPLLLRRPDADKSRNGLGVGTCIVDMILSLVFFSLSFHSLVVLHIE